MATFTTDVNSHNGGPALVALGSVYTTDANIVVRSSSGYGNAIGFSNLGKPAGLQRWNIGVGSDDAFYIAGCDSDDGGWTNAARFTRAGDLSIWRSVTATSFNGYNYSVTALNAAPASASATGTVGQIRWTDGYVYLCVATNTWKRAALTTW